MSWDISEAGLGLDIHGTNGLDSWTESHTATFPGAAHPKPDQEYNMDSDTLDPMLGSSNDSEYYAILFQVSASTSSQTSGGNNGYFTEFSAESSGVALELANFTDGSAVDPFAPPDNDIDINAFVMRPTALSWPLQDPANSANRIMWSPADTLPLIDVHTHVVVVAPFPAAITTRFSNYQMQALASARGYNDNYVPPPPVIAIFI
jgi:hypothetical protein